MKPSYLGVAVDAPLRRVFDYLPPEGCANEQLRRGHRVRVPFGRRKVVGLIVEAREVSDVPADRVRRCFEALDSDPALPPELFDLLVWAADYYHHPVGEVLLAALPTALRAGTPLAAETLYWRLTDEGRQQVAAAKLPPRASRLRAVCKALLEGDRLDAAQLGTTVPHWREAMRTLEKRGWAEHVVDRRPEPKTTPRREQTAGPQLSPAQATAVAAIVEALGSPRQFLLHGVTGSGKTEIYLRAIEAAVALGGQALVLVPEIALTPQLVQRFTARFDVPIASLHSGLTDSARLDAWRDAREGRARIVIGTRSAVFAPLVDSAIVIVDEEHDPSYKQQDGFRYSARDLAIARAQREGIPIVLGSATPSLESLARVARGLATRLALPQRAGSARPPRVALVDLRHHAAEQGLSTPAMLAMRRHLEAGGQILLYLNRRGYAPVLFCAQCGWTAACRRCDARMTLHRREQRLTCHHCGLESPVPERCPDCDAETRPVGQGTERIEETVARLFPQAPIARIDRDMIRRRGQLEDALARVDSGDARILIGTQMLTKGHHFPRVTLVVVLNADQGLFSTDFRASERLAQTIVQVAGRAGRAEHAGEVLIQTEFPDHPLLARLLEGGYDAFATAALAERAEAGWPPSARLALFRAEATHERAALAFLAAVHDLCRTHTASDLEILGPAPAPMQRRAGRYRAQLLLRAPTHGPVQRALRNVLPRIEELPASRRVRWSIDVDPLELF